MANNYLQFSESLPLSSDEERAWVASELTRLEGQEDKDGMAVLDFQYQIESDGLWLYAEESAEPYKVGQFVQAFLKKFRPDGHFTLTWATTCSKLRLSEFSGGGMVVTARKIYMLAAESWCHDKLTALDRKRDRKRSLQRRKTSSRGGARK